MAGIEVIGRDNYGCFPLKGKLLNVRDANLKQLTANEEIQNLIKIIGLQVGKKYENLEELRYGSVMIMTDQDTDGSHIKGLIINFIEHFWPDLFKFRGFLKEFVTPIIKVTHKTRADRV
jgi:DNA topoisomerase-2